MRDVHNGALGIAVHQQIGLGVDQHRAAHFLRPVIEMRDAAQARLDAANDDGHIGIGFARALAVDDDTTIGPLAAFAFRGIGIIAADTPVRSVAIHHRIHVACTHAEKQFRPTQYLERISAVPVRLRDDANAEALRFQQAPDDGHAETGMIDVGITGDDDDVAFVPAERLHFRARHRQVRCRAQARRPVLAVAEQVFGAVLGVCCDAEGGSIGCGLHQSRTVSGGNQGPGTGQAFAHYTGQSPIGPRMGLMPGQPDPQCAA